MGNRRRGAYSVFRVDSASTSLHKRVLGIVSRQTSSRTSSREARRRALSTQGIQGLVRAMLVLHHVVQIVFSTQRSDAILGLGKAGADACLSEQVAIRSMRSEDARRGERSLAATMARSDSRARTEIGTEHVHEIVAGASSQSNSG